jgi:hypothetical protein
MSKVSRMVTPWVFEHKNKIGNPWKPHFIFKKNLIDAHYV